MKRNLAIATILAGLGWAAPASAAANKEHQQLMAEIRMLQEQQQELQQLLGTLADAVKTVNAKLDEQSGATRKAFADSALQLTSVVDGVRVLREKVDNVNVQISALAPEMESVRQAVAQCVPGGATAAPAPGGGVPTAASPTAGGAQPSVNPNPVPPGVSPQRLYDESFADYSAGRWDLAIDGFQQYIRTFPRSPLAADAQLYVGQTYFYQNKWKEAVDAFQKVIADYPQSPSVPAAYYKLGQVYERLNQLDEARKAYNTAITNFPNSNEAILAKQALERLNKKE